MDCRLKPFQELKNYYYALCLPAWLIPPLTAALILGGCSFQAANQKTTMLVKSAVPETEFTISDPFLRFFEKYGGVNNLGQPLTEVITVDGWSMQYFEYARLEYHPENEPEYLVTVGWLGEVLNRRQPPIPASKIPPKNDSSRRYYAQTGHTLSGDFLAYFAAHGGSVRFGLPISEPFLWQGQLTQDFQSARFFWTPDRPMPVTLEAIGKVHLEQLTFLKK